MKYAIGMMKQTNLSQRLEIFYSNYNEDIITVKKFPIFKNDSVYSLTQRCYAYIYSSFVEIFPFIISNTPLPGSDEQWKRKPFTRRELNDLCRITSDMSVDEIKRRVKATAYPPDMPGAFIELEGIKFIANTSSVEDSDARDYNHRRGGGHAKVLIDLIKTSGKYEIAGILDSQLKVSSVVSEISVLGSDKLLVELYEKGIKNACIAVGSIKDNSKRKMLYEKVKQTGFFIPFLIHPQTIVSKVSKISEGVQVMAGAIIQAGSFVGENTIINTGGIIEHDCVIGKHVHICPGAVISGGVTIGDSTFIGAGTTIIQGIKIGNNSVIAAGAVVINNVPEGVTVKGVPAKIK